MDGHKSWIVLQLINNWYWRDKATQLSAGSFHVFTATSWLWCFVLQDKTRELLYVQRGRQDDRVRRNLHFSKISNYPKLFLMSVTCKRSFFKRIHSKWTISCMLLKTIGTYLFCAPDRRWTEIDCSGSRPSVTGAVGFHGLSTRDCSVGDFQAKYSRHIPQSSAASPPPPSPRQWRC